MPILTEPGGNYRALNREENQNQRNRYQRQSDQVRPALEDSPHSSAVGEQAAHRSMVST